MKARTAAEAKKFQDLPNVGPRVANDFKKLGFAEPHELAGADALVLYKKLCTLTKSRQDPCVLDVFLAVTDFMSGASPRPWWHYTPERKKRFGKL